MSASKEESLCNILLNKNNLMVFSFLHRKCHPPARCIKKINDGPCYHVIFYLEEHNTNMSNKKGNPCVYH